MAAETLSTTQPDRRLSRVRIADRLALVAFGSIALITLVLIVAITVFVLSEAWPSFRDNGLGWLSDSPTSLDTQLSSAFTTHSAVVHAWPAILGTLLTTGGALLIAFPFALLASIFIADLAPSWLVRFLDPVVTLLAGTPSVVFGLFALLAVAPLIQDHLVNQVAAADYAPIVLLSGTSLLLGIVVLAVMIAPVMVAIFVDALRAVPNTWTEGAIALGCDRWRATRRVSLAAIRPALVAGTGLAVGRAVGEAIALSMVAGSVAFTPNPLDGVNAFFEPVRPLASAIVDYSEEFDAATLRADLFAFGALLLVITAAMTIGAKVIASRLDRRLHGA